jgi:DNA-binding MarR family transcriptional regulator
MSTATAVKIATGASPNGAPAPSREAKVPAGIGTPAGRSATPGAIGTPCVEQLSEGELRALRGLMRAHASLAKRLDAELERAHGLPLSSYEVLHHLEGAPDGRMRMCDLAEHAQLSRSGLTRLVDRLERDGLLSRCTCEHDARGAYACLTEQGVQRLGEARGTHLAVVREQFLSRFSEPELGALAEMWDRIAPCCGCTS